MNNNEWISVKDRLPELSTDDYFDHNNGYSNKVVVFESGDTFFAKLNLRISEWIVFGRTGNIQVTHWMPLPKPPSNE
jgi:hypothetical protein